MNDGSDHVPDSKQSQGSMNQKVDEIIILLKGIDDKFEMMLKILREINRRG